MRKPVFEVSDQVRHKPGCTAIEDGQSLEVSVLDRRGIVLSIAKIKALISFAVPLISWFSHMKKAVFFMTRLI